MKNYNEMIYHFCQQCFCFLKIDIIFGKILNCYKFYRKENVQIKKIKNLIDFLNVLIVEYFDYYKIAKNEDLLLMKNVYYEIISDLIINNIYNNKRCDNQKALTKKEIVNMNLYYNENENNKKDKIDKSIFDDYEIISLIIEKDKDENNDSFDEDDENNKKTKIIKYIYSLFLQDIFGAMGSFLKPNYNDYSIITITEYILTDIANILKLLNSKKTNYEVLQNLKEKLTFYRFLQKRKTDNKNINMKAIDIISFRTINKEIKNKKYMRKGIFSILDWKVEEIGQQLMRNTVYLLRSIERKELYRAPFLKDDKTLYPNLAKSSDYFNKLTFFIIEDVLSYDHVNDRVKIIEKWLQVAEYCKLLKDYNDCLAINSALNHYTINRLKLTQKELKGKNISLIKELNDFCFCGDNYKKVREKMEKLNSLKECYYPYVGMVRRDIVTIDSKLKYLENGLINFTKIEKINNIMENYFRFKNETLKNINYIQELNFFEKLENIKENYLKMISEYIEPVFLLNNKKKKFKRATKIDELYFSEYNKSLGIQRSSSIHNLMIHK
jgi:hypothetical protein